jgi:glycosyltransferase involved in cell wall biosynthesis
MEKTAIVIITKNRGKLFHQTIRSLIENTPRELYDLIVVDDGSNNISDLCELKDRGIIDHLILTNQGSPGACRNLGMEIVKRGGYKYVYHSDNDMYFLPRWIEKCQEQLRHHPIIKLIAPYGHPYHLPNGEFEEKEGDRVYCYGVNACAGNSWYLETETYLKYGLAENKGIMCSEDHAFCIRLRKDGYICARFVDNLVLHTGICNSSGDPATGAEQMLDELTEAKIKHKLEIYYE